MPLADDEGLGLFAGLNVLPKTTFLHDYSYPGRRGPPSPSARRGGAGPSERGGLPVRLVQPGLPHHPPLRGPGSHPPQKNYVPRRSQSVPSVAVAYAQEEGSEELVYAEGDVLKREKRDQVLRFVEYPGSEWRGKLPEELVFDSQMTTHGGLAALQKQKVVFLTLRERQAQGGRTATRPSRVGLEDGVADAREPGLTDILGSTRRGLRSRAIVDG